MSYGKVTVIIPETKKNVLGSKPVYKSGTCAFKTKSGKKIVIPEDSVVFQDEKTIVYKFGKRKILKGDFIVKDGFLYDEDLGCRISSQIVSMGEEKAPMTAEQKKAAKKRVEAMKAAKGNGDKKVKKLKVKKRKS